MATEDPGQEALLAWHAALRGGDVTASARLAELLLPALRRRFAGRRELDRDEIDSFIGETIARYLATPDCYDPGRAPLLAYLYRDADGDIRNEAARRRRHPEVALPGDGEVSLLRDRIELAHARGNPTLEEQVLDRLDPLDRPRAQVKAALAAIRDLSAEDRGFLLRRADGVRSAHAYAEILGIAHLPAEQQRREVKRAKDRLDKRLGSIRGRFSP